ncbi:Polyvinylalcohol dehydrogenase [uncultured virus]|nr:Polyvinylalcohol dehydrogenase [uncultured virus]
MTKKYFSSRDLEKSLMKFFLILSILTIALGERDRDDKANNAQYQGQGHALKSSHGGSDCQDDDHDQCEETTDYAMNTRGTHYKPSWINKHNVASLQHLWQFQGCGAITASPVVLHWGVCWSDYGGCFQCVRHNGTLIAQKNLTSDYGLMDHALSRQNPTYADGRFVILQTGRFGFLPPSYGTWLLTVNATTLELIAKVQVTFFNFSLLTQSPIVKDGWIYFGTSSNEEGSPFLYPGYPCCNFAGQFFSYNLYTLQQRWVWDAIPAALVGPGKYSGVAIWSGSPLFYKNLVIFSTGNLYSQPASVDQCLLANPTNGSCIDPGVHYDSIVAVDINTGLTARTRRSGEPDAWNGACFARHLLPGCPLAFSEDADFGNPPMLSLPGPRGKRYINLGQKNGMEWSIDADTFEIVNVSLVAPGDEGGGFQFGGTMNNLNQVFLASANNGRKPHLTLSGQNITCGSWMRFNVTGALEKELVSPKLDTIPGAMSSTNDVVFGGTGTGRLVAMSNDLEILWSYETGIKINAAPAIYCDRLYWGTGSNPSFSGPMPGIMHAFGLPDL